MPRLDEKSLAHSSHRFNQSFPTEKGGTRMLRMEIALFLVVAFVAYMYFTAEKEH